MEQINYKVIFTFSIPYLTICAVLWNIGYWSTFDLRILENMGLTDLLTSFIFPFTSTSALFLLGYFISSLLFSKITVYGGAEETMNRSLLIKTRIIISILFLSNLVFYFFIKDSIKWVLICAMISIPIMVLLNNNNFLIKIIPPATIRRNFVMAIILIPFLSFGFAKKLSLDIDQNNATDVQIELKTNRFDSNICSYKHLGKVGDYVFFKTNGKREIIGISKSDIESIKYIKNAP